MPPIPEPDDAMDAGELLRAFKDTPAHRLKVLTLADEVILDRPDRGQYDEADGTYGYHVAEVEVLGHHRWFVWSNVGYEVAADSVQLCEGRSDADARWKELCASKCDVYFDDWEYEDDPGREPRAPGQIEARLDRQWQFAARATGLPERESRAVLKARMDVGEIARATGGSPTDEQIGAYRVIAALRT